MTTLKNTKHKNNACQYIDCLLCNAQTKYAFHRMQQRLFASRAFSLQAIHDIFCVKVPLMNFDSLSELHNEFQVVLKD
jgi:hypothetical protein